MKLARFIPESLPAQLIILVIVAFVARGAFFSQPQYKALDEVGIEDLGSTPRFLLQARYLSEGRGYLHRDTTLCTSLPPGYPACLSVAFLITKNLKVLSWIQVLISVGSCVLLFLALRPWGAIQAFVLTLLFAMHPWVAGFASRFMSESGGIFWSTLAAYLISKSHHDGYTVPRSIGIGLAAMALCLTSPGAAPLAALVWACLFFWHAKAPKPRVGLVIGSCLLFVPWQAWCVHVNGKPAPMLITPLEYPGVGPWEWMKSWIITTEDQRLARGLTMDHVDGFAGLAALPEYAFENPEDREEFDVLVTAFRTSGSIRADDSTEFKALDDALLRVANKSRSENPLRWYVTLPAIRTLSLWFQPGNVGLVSIEYAKRLLPNNAIAEVREHGAKRGIKRLGRGLVSAIAWLIHACFPVALVWAGGLGVRKRHGLALVILTGILVYTYTSGLWAAFEFRRNLVFLPWVAFAFVISRSSDSDPESVDA